MAGCWYSLTKSQHESLRDPEHPHMPYEPMVIEKKDLDTIDDLLASHFAPSLHKQICRTRQTLERLQFENELLRREIASLRLRP
jgi:hypothetical protein